MDTPYDSPGFTDDLRNAFGDSKSKNTIANYISQVKNILGDMKIKTIRELTRLNISQWTKYLNKFPLNTRSARINAFIVVSRVLGVPQDKSRFDSLKALNSELGKEKMGAMKANKIDREIPEDFDKKVDAYLEANKGTAKALLMAMMTKAPPVRTHSLEGIKIAYNQTQYGRMVRGEQSGVLGWFNGVARLTPLNLKVKQLGRHEIVYPEAVAEQLKAYLKPKQDFLFAEKTQTLNKWLKGAFEEAGLGTVGVQLLRRIAETKNENDPSKTYADKEAFSKQMNHSRDMGAQYAVKESQKRGEEEQALYKAIGAELSSFTTMLLNIVDKTALETILGAVKEMHQTAQVMAELGKKKSSYKPTGRPRGRPKKNA